MISRTLTFIRIKRATSGSRRTGISDDLELLHLSTSPAKPSRIDFLEQPLVNITWLDALSNEKASIRWTGRSPIPRHCEMQAVNLEAKDLHLIYAEDRW